MINIIIPFYIYREREREISFYIWPLGIPACMAMAKPFVTLGSFVPYGQEFLSETAESGSYQLLPVEHDAIIAEEEIYIAKDGRCIWSSGRHIVCGFDQGPNPIQAVRCSFSQLTKERGLSGTGDWALLTGEALVVKSDAQEFVAKLGPLVAKRIWPLADGVLILVANSQGGEHAVTLVGHPFNLPRSISYIEAAPPLVTKDLLSSEGDFQPRWVSKDLPVALAYSLKTRRHSVFLLRRRRLETIEGLGGGTGASDGTLMEQAVSEVFFQRLYTIPEEGPSCDLDDVSLLAPDCNFPYTTNKATCEAAGPLLAFFIRSSERLLVLRLWTGEVLANLSASSWVALLPGHDLQLRHTGLFASAPSRWLGSTGCRFILKEDGGPKLPTAEGLDAHWADEFLDPLELTRRSAVLTFDRHRVPQYLLVLNEARLILHWGPSKLFEVSLPCLTSPIIWLGDAVANRFTVRTQDGQCFRCMAPLEPTPRLAGVMSAVSALFPRDFVEMLTSDVQVWCVGDVSGRENAEDEEWWRFCELFFCLLEQALSEVSPGNSPPYKRLRKTPPCNEEMGSDWDWLLGSDVHAKERQRPRYAGLSASQDFRPSEPRSLELWQSKLQTKTEPLRHHLEEFFLTLHLLYEEWKLHTLKARWLPSMAAFLYAVAKRLNLKVFEEYYAKDDTSVTDAALAMTRFGGYGVWLWQNAGGGVPLLEKLRKAKVPNLLATRRRDRYQKTFASIKKKLKPQEQKERRKEERTEGSKEGKK